MNPRQVLSIVMALPTTMWSLSAHAQDETDKPTGAQTPPEPAIKPEGAPPSEAVKQEDVPKLTQPEAGAPLAKAEISKESQASPKNETEDASDKVKVDVNGSAIIYFYQPFLPEVHHNFELLFANGIVDASMGDFGLHTEGRIRATKLFSYYPSNVWVEEIYAYYKHEYVTAKVGKVYSQFGVFWDGSFSGNVHMYEGLKLDTDYGISLEGSTGGETGMTLGYVLQYFIRDADTNYSAPGRDTLSIADSHQRHSVVARAQPAYHFKKDVALTMGLSGQYFQADLATVGKKNVFRFGGDLKFEYGPWSIFGEFTRQIGQSVTDHPFAGTEATATEPAVPGRASSHNNYVIASSQIKIWKFTPRYAFSAAQFQDVDVSEGMHNAGVAFDPHDNITLALEYVRWQRNDLAASTLLDHSLYVVLWPHF